MRRYLRGRRRFGSRGGTNSLMGYFQLRKNSILFLALFLCGLLLSSIYTVRDCRETRLILSLVANQVQNQAVSGYWTVLTGRLIANLGPVVFLYFAANCLQGKWLAGFVPVFYGLSVGATVTALLFQHGLGAGQYLFICVLLPRFAQLVLLMAACNQTVKLSQSISSQRPAGERSFLLFGVGMAGISMIETLIIGRFTGLLTYL